MAKWGLGKVLKYCERCQIEFSARHDRLGKYCSKSCASRRPGKKQRFILKCKTCNRNFEVKKHRVGIALYCSPDCRRKNMPSGENHPNWKGGISTRTYASRKAIKEAKKIKNVCEKCGSNENLQGHHKIKYSQNINLQNDINNIEIICAKCHSKEHPELTNMIMLPRVRSGIIKVCFICQKKYYVPQYKIQTSKYCSRTCTHIGIKRSKYDKKLDQRCDKSSA